MNAVRMGSWIAHAVFLLGTFAVFGCFTSEICTNALLSEVTGPDGRMKAVIFKRSCAESAQSTHVSIVSTPSTLPVEGGNVFAAKTKQRPVPEVPGAQPDVEVFWLGPTTLTVRYLNGTEVVRAEPLVEGVAVLYGQF